MDFAFWRRKKTVGGATSASPRPSSPPDDLVDHADPTAALRVRARRRLIGAAALLLAVTIVVPMLLDPQPRPVPDNIPIDIPSERTPFTPRLSLPPPGDTPQPITVAPTAPAPETRREAKADAKAEARPDAKDVRVEEQRAVALLEGKGGTAPAAQAQSGKFMVQVAAPANPVAARELAERLRKAGYATVIEPVELKEGTRHRVRVGPYATRADAERARGALKTLGLDGNLIGT